MARQRGKCKKIFQESFCEKWYAEKQDSKSLAKFPQKVLQRVLSKRGSKNVCATGRSGNCFFSLTKQLASAFAQTFSYHVGEHARAKTAKIHRTAAASTSSAGGAHRMYGKYGLVRLNEIGRLSLLKEAVLVSCLAFFSPLGGCRCVEDANR